MKYTQQASQFTEINRFTDKRSVAETLLETINETLGKGPRLSAAWWRRWATASRA